MGLTLCSFVRKLSPSGLKVDSALIDRQRTQGCATEEKENRNGFVKNGKKDKANKDS